MQLLTSIINNLVIDVRLIIHSVLLTSRQKRAFAIIDLPYDKANITCDTNIEPAAVNTLGLMAFRSSRYSTPGRWVTNRLSRHTIWRKCKFYTKRSSGSQCVKGHRSRLNSFVCITRICLSLYYRTTCINMTKGKSQVFPPRHNASQKIKTTVLRYLTMYFISFEQNWLNAVPL